MKRLVPVLSLSVLGLFAVPACENKGDAGSGPVDTGKLDKSFQSADADTKTVVNRAIESIKAGNYQQALTDLQPLVANVKLTDDQKQTLKDTISQLTQKISGGVKGATDKAKDAAGKGVEDLKKSLGG